MTTDTDNRPSAGGWRLLLALIAPLAALALAAWIFSRPSYEELLEREAVARLKLSVCAVNALASCAAERAAYEKAHARVLDATP